MQMRRTIGISLACLVTSACAIDKTPEESASHYPEEATGVPQGNAETSCCSPVLAVEKSQFGQASWYGMVGSKTASGELLDRVTATAAHRSLPLASYAKVTNLDSGCSVIVRINDRGPYIRGRIIDLSPHAADVLDMKRVGVAAVVVEPFVN
jgi:peptidoglycan lytic transglycosylase